MGMMGMEFGGGGGHRSAGNPGGGLPFSGVPWEMQDGVNRLLEDEPEFPEPKAAFTYRYEDGREGLSLFSLMRTEMRLALLSSLAFIATALLTQVGPKLIQVGIDQGMIKHKSMTIIVVLSGIYLVSIAFNAYAMRATARVTGRFAAKIMGRLRVKVFTHLQRLGLGFYTEEKAGVILSRMTSDIDNLQQFYQDGFGSIVTQLLTMVVITGVLFTISVKLTVLAVLLSMIPLLVVSLWFRIASEAAFEATRDGIARVLADLSENLHGFRTMTAHNRQARNVVEHRNVVGDYRRANDRTAQLNGVYGPATQLIGGLSQAVLLAVGGDMMLKNQISAGALVAFFLYINRFFGPIQLLVQQYSLFQQSNASIFKLRALFGTRPEADEAPDASVLPPVDGEIVFEHVSFGYDPKRPVLHEVDFTLAPGETVAFVGQTGAGKSTIAKLVTRFYDPTLGRVLIDGHDLTTVTIDSLRKQIGVVPQEAFLFAGTLRYNIAFARQEATDDEVWEAVHAVGMTEVVEKMPDGLDTMVHERGQSLSSGERQLVSLARAFHARPRVLVLDEATSNLDLASEAKVERALDVLLQGRTAILIAHRLSTAMKADRICVMHDGRIVESGPHHELIMRGGLYAEMFATWISHSEGSAA